MAMASTEHHDSLTIVVPSDIHDDVEAIDSMARDLARRRVRADVIVCPGDLTSAPTMLGEPLTATKDQHFRDRAQQVLQALEECAPEVYFVPGNHDPDCMFTPCSTGSKQGPTGAINVHESPVQLRAGLWVVGFGGCVEATENGKQVWGAYPFCEAECALRVRRISRHVSDVPQHDKVIVVTHAGPAMSATTCVSGRDPNCLHTPGIRGHPDQWIRSGSTSISDMIAQESAQTKVILNVHGHTHYLPLILIASLFLFAWSYLDFRVRACPRPPLPLRHMP